MKNCQKHKVLIPFNSDEIIQYDEQLSFNAGYLFLQKIYFQLGLPSICRKIKKENGFSYDLDEILSRLVYGRILYPSSNLSCYEQSKSFWNSRILNFTRSTVLCQSLQITWILYRQNFINVLKSHKTQHRDSFLRLHELLFELEQASGLKQYGISKEHRPNPIVQMGLFMDKSGIPLAFCINDGNQNEQLSLQPLEQQIMRDFEHSKFVVCTDAGLSSDANLRFNNYGERSFITTQSIKKLTADLKDWSINPDGWHLEGKRNL